MSPFRSFVGLAGGEAIARVLAFVAMLIVARRLGPSMYGVIGVVSGIMLYLTQVADAGIELAGVPAVARQQSGLAAVVSSTLSVRLLLAVSLTLVVIAIGVLAFPQPDGALLALYALSLIFVAAGTRWVFLGLQKAFWVAVARIGGELTALAIVAFLLHDVGDVAVVPIAAVVGAAVASLLMLGGLRRLGVRPVLTRDWALSRPLFERGPHLVGFTLLGLVLFNSGLIYLRYVSGEAAAGYFAAAYTFIAFPANLSAAWAHSVLPAIARVEQADAAETRSEVYGRAMLLAFAVALPVAVGGMLVATPLVDLLFGAEYRSAVPALLWLLPAVPIAAVREVSVTGLISSERGERQLFRINAICALVNVAFLIPIVPRFGATGAASVTVLTEAIRLALAVRDSRKRGFHAPQLVRYLKPCLAGALMVLGVLAAGDRPLVVLVSAGAILYTVGLLATGALKLGPLMRPRIVL